MPVYDLIADFEKANLQAIDYVLGPAAQHWDEPTVTEGWPVGVTARHIALGHQLVTEWLRAMRSREAITGLERIDEVNAKEAARGVVATPEEVVDLLRANGAEVRHALSGLTDDDLDRMVEFGPQQLPGEMVAGASIRHIEAHLRSIEQVVDRPANG